MEYTEGGSNKDYQENGRNRYYTDGPDNHYYTGGQPAQRVQSTDDATINIKEWVFRFLSYWYLFVISVVIALCLGYIKNRSWKPQYTTESKIIIAEAKSTTDYNFMQNFVGGMSYANATTSCSYLVLMAWLTALCRNCHSSLTILKEADSKPLTSTATSQFSSRIYS